MNCTEKVDRHSVVVVNTDDFLYTHKFQGKRVYLAAYVVEGGGYYIDPDMVVDMLCQLLDYPDSCMTVCPVGVFIGIVPLESHENLEEGMSGEVMFYYQVLLDNGKMVLVSSLAFDRDTLKGACDADPHYQEWLSIKLDDIEKVCP